jgi:hypothetical protein
MADYFICEQFRIGLGVFASNNFGDHARKTCQKKQVIDA